MRRNGKSETCPYQEIGWKNSIHTHFAPPHPCAMLAKRFDLTQACILLVSNIDGGNGVLALIL